jgi:hypothetical protein
MQPTKSERSSLQLPSWNEGIRQAFDDPRDKAAAKAGHHQTAGPRRVLASAQVTGVYNQRQLAPTDPTAPRADVLDSLPDAREAEYWLRRAAAAEEGGRPEEAERLLMGALERDVRPATAVAHALHELHARWEGAPVATGEPPACLLLLGCCAWRAWPRELASNPNAWHWLLTPPPCLPRSGQPCARRRCRRRRRPQNRHPPQQDWAHRQGAARARPSGRYTRRRAARQVQERAQEAELLRRAHAAGCRRPARARGAHLGRGAAAHRHQAAPLWRCQGHPADRGRRRPRRRRRRQVWRRAARHLWGRGAGALAGLPPAAPLLAGAFPHAALLCGGGGRDSGGRGGRGRGAERGERQQPQRRGHALLRALPQVRGALHARGALPPAGDRDRVAVADAW